MVFGVFHGKSTNTDVLEIFTKQILSKTGAKPNPTEMPPSTEAAMERCELLKKITLEMQNMSQTGATLNINNWSVTDINNYLQVSLDLKDRKTVTSIMNQMLDSKQLPSNSLIIRTFSFLCDDCADSMELVTGIIEVCQEKNLPFYATSIELEPFKAQYLWKFERYDDALHTLNSIFTTRNKTIKSLILQNYRQITYNGVTHQDEAILEKLITNALGICDKYNDPSLLTYVWSDCFFSELFRNQQRASHLFGAHETVRQAVSRDIGWFALTLIQQHNIDAIHRLIENCLASSMKREVGVCLVALFDYHCKYLCARTISLQNRIS